jgi:hypothetical protein
MTKKEKDYETYIKLLWCAENNDLEQFIKLSKQLNGITNFIKIVKAAIENEHKDIIAYIFEHPELFEKDNKIHGMRYDDIELWIANCLLFEDSVEILRNIIRKQKLEKLSKS